MKKRMAGVAIALALGWGMAVAGPAAADEDVTKHPGYVDFSALSKLFTDDDANIEVLIDENMIKFFQFDPELRDLTAKLKQIRVQSYRVDRSSVSKVEASAEELSKRLEKEQWSTMAKIRDREDGENTYVYVKMKDSTVQGLAVMNLDPRKEVTFVNIVGELDPEKMQRLSRKMHIEGLDSLDVDWHHRDRDRDRDRKRR